MCDFVFFIFKIYFECVFTYLCDLMNIEYSLIIKVVE